MVPENDWSLDRQAVNGAAFALRFLRVPTLKGHASLLVDEIALQPHSLHQPVRQQRLSRMKLLVQPASQETCACSTSSESNRSRRELWMEREPEGRSPARSAGKAERNDRRARHAAHSRESDTRTTAGGGRGGAIKPYHPPHPTPAPPNVRGSTSRTVTPEPHSDARPSWLRVSA
jgi:hypothetical protein